MVLRLTALTQLHWRRWNDEWTVFDVGSGQTHLMDTLTAVTLMFLEKNAMDEDELISLIAQKFLFPLDIKLSNTIKDIIERLINIDLVESVSL